MDSRDKHGERLRSNRLKRDTTTRLTPPEPNDIVVRTISYDGTAEWPPYDHPGGMQQVGNIIAIGVELPLDPSDPPVLVQFVDVTDPENPQLRSTFVPPAEAGARAGVAALTPCGADREGMPCATDHYLLGISGGNNATVHFYESEGDDLASPGLSWNLLYTWSKDELIAGDWHEHQTLQFLREGSLSGALYLAGARGDGSPLDITAEDWIDLYRVELDGSTVRIEQVSSLHMNTHPAGQGVGPRVANFAAASAFHVTPSGELIFYAAEHDNDGPDGDNGRGSVKMGEWRHTDMVRGSSTLSPSLTVGGPYVVDEGDSILLAATGNPPITKAWIQLFQHSNFDGRNIVVDYDDWGKDDFDDFKRLDPNFLGPLAADADGASDEASSWRWFAPQGCTIRVNDDHISEGSSSPGQFTRTLYGTASVETASDLGSVANDDDDGNLSMNDEITSMQFFSDCDDYYGAAINVVWDLDGSGSFDIASNEPAFNATDLDGPDIVGVQVRGEHPTDWTALGLGSPVPVQIQVNNVPPIVESFGIFDALGLEVGVDTPFVFVSLGMTAVGTFTDPGKPDTQVATIDWDDGAADPSAEFDIFTDASGGVTGLIEQQHLYRQAGTYSIRLGIADDDDGRTSVTLDVEVVSPINALESVVEELDLILATTTGTDEYTTAILDAQNSLVGNDIGAGNNGAIDKITSEEPMAALTMIEAALEALQRAEIAGSDLGGLMNILGLTAETIAQAVYLDVVAAIGIPSRGEAKQLQRIQQSIADGHALLLSGDYLAAIEMYQDAVGRANKFLA
ncbi:MAG: hypothetical protein U9P00_03850 [Pseudomonadota bacterium]|nr:hypothetical protein [Pseudomonadota bacterium]